VIASHKDFVLIWQFYEPVQEVQHLFLCTIIADVPAMNKDISNWYILYLVMQPCVSERCKILILE
jgi:hypothetical protein